MALSKNDVLKAAVLGALAISMTGNANAANDVVKAVGLASQPSVKSNMSGLTSIQTNKNSVGGVDLVLSFNKDTDIPNAFNIQDASGGMVIFDFKNTVSHIAPKIIPPKDSELLSLDIKETEDKTRLVVKSKTRGVNYNVVKNGNKIVISFAGQSAVVATSQMVAEVTKPISELPKPVAVSTTPIQPTPVMAVAVAKPNEPIKQSAVAVVQTPTPVMVAVVSKPVESVKVETPVVAVTKPTFVAETSMVSKLKPEVKGVSFKKGKDSTGGLFMIDLTDPKVTIDIKPSKNSIVIDLFGTDVPKYLIGKKVSVANLGTPVRSYEFSKLSDRARIVLITGDQTEQNAYQVDNKLVLNIKPVYSETIANKSAVKKYTGQKVTLNFQDIEVRSLLQVIADYSNLNIVASDTVEGKITLRLQDIPWDQALEIIQQTKNLGSKKDGNVIWIAPLKEIREKEKAEFDYKIEKDSVIPLITESIQLNYQKATDIKVLLDKKTSSVAGIKRGSVLVDPKTNIIFIEDTPEKIEELRELIKKIDIPIRQVMIEAKIVEATKNFAKNVGARLGVNGQINNRTAFGGGLEATTANTGQFATSPTLSQTLGVSLPATAINGAVPSVFSFLLFNKSLSRFLNMEISAIENDGTGTILSNPRVVTSDRSEAVVAQGTQIPYQESASSGATTISFKDATLSMKVTPQIAPNGKILMDLAINKDSVGTQTPNGPAIDTQNVKTQVMVDNEGTVAIGGIYTEENTASVNKVPFLGDLPYVGFLFKQRATNKSQREIIVFITPKVVTEAGGITATEDSFQGSLIKEIPMPKK